MSQATAYIDLIARDESVKQAAARTERIARETKAKLEGMKITMKVDLGATQAKAQADVIVREAQRAAAAIQQVNAAAMGAPNRFAGYSSSLVRAGQWRGSNPATADAPWLIRPRVPAGLTRQQAADYLRTVRNPADVTGGLPFDPVREARQRFAQTSGGGTTIVAGQGGVLEQLLTSRSAAAITTRGFISVKIIEKVIDSAAAIGKAVEGLNTATRGRIRDDFKMESKGLLKFHEGIRNLPLGVGKVLGKGTDLFSGGAFGKAQAALDTSEAQERQIVERREQDRQRRIAFRDELAASRLAAMPEGTAEQRAAKQRAAIVRDQELALADIDRRSKLKAGEDGYLGFEPAKQLREATRSQFAQRLAAMRKQEIERESDLTFSGGQKAAAAENIDMRLAGRGREADRNDFLLKLAADQRAADRQLGYRSTDQAALNEAKLKEFDEQKKREIVAETTRIEGMERAKNLRAAKQDYEADVAEFEAAWDSKLATIADANEKEIALREKRIETEAREAGEKERAGEIMFQAKQLTRIAEGKSGEARIEEIGRRLEKNLQAGGDVEDEASRALAVAELKAFDRELRFKEETTKAAVFSNASMRDLGAGVSDVGRESLAVLRDRIAKGIQTIVDNKGWTQATPVAG